MVCSRSNVSKSLMLILKRLACILLTSSVFCATDEMMHQRCATKLVPDHLIHNMNKAARKKKVDLTAKCADGSRAFYKSSYDLFSRSNVMEIVANHVIEILRLPVLHSRARGTMLQLRRGEDSQEIFDKIRTSRRLNISQPVEPVLFCVRLDFLSEVDAHEMRVMQLLKLRWNLFTSVLKDGCHSNAVRYLASSFGGILVLDAVIGNYDRAAKNCRLSPNGTWIAFDNEKSRSRIPPMTLLQDNTATDCIGEFLPEYSSASLYRQGLESMSALLANVNHGWLARQLQDRLAADLLIQHYESRLYPKDKVSDFLSRFHPDINASSLVKQHDGGSKVSFQLAKAYSRFVEARFIKTCQGLSSLVKVRNTGQHRVSNKSLAHLPHYLCN